MVSWCPALQTRAHPETAVVRRAEWKKHLILAEKVNFCALVLYISVKKYFLNHICTNCTLHVLA